MKKSKLILIIGTLLLTLGLLAACGGKDDEPPEETRVSIDLSQYTIVRPEKTTDYCLGAATKMYSTLAEKGIKLSVSDDWLADGENADGKKEILIGDTNRPESAAAKQALEGNDYLITVSGDKLVFTASKDAYLTDAVEYFAESIFTGEAALSLEDGFCYGGKSQSIALIAADKATAYTVIRNRYDTSRGEIGEATSEICSTIYNKTGAFIKVEQDHISDSTSLSFEILIGRTNRKESGEALAMCEPDEYIIAFIGNKIAVTSPSSVGLTKALEKFSELVKSNCDDAGLALLKENIKGKIGAVTVSGVPAPEGLTLVSSYVGRGDIFESVWKAQKSDFDAYRLALASAGYSAYADNEINGNLFASYTKGKALVSVSYLPHDGTMRIISETYTHLPPLTDSHTKVMDTTLTQFCLGADNVNNDDKRNFGMSYAFQLADGSFMCIDGGGNWGDDYTDMYAYMDANKKGDKIVIAAWLFTHDHWDHLTGFISFMNRYGSSVTLESIGHNFPANETTADSTNYADSLLSIVKKKAPSCKIYTLHAGQKFAVRDAVVEILFTHELFAPYYVPDKNETSTVFRVFAGGKSILFLGDISTVQGHEKIASEIILDMYGDSLKCDIMQVAHHGWDGATKELYNAITPKIALWPVHSGDYSIVVGKSTSKHLLSMISSGKISKCYFSKDGTVTLTLADE